MLDELLVGGEIQETSKKNIIRAVSAQDMLQEVGNTTSPLTTHTLIHCVLQWWSVLRGNDASCRIFEKPSLSKAKLSPPPPPPQKKTTSEFIYMYVTLYTSVCLCTEAFVLRNVLMVFLHNRVAELHENWCDYSSL